MEKSMTAQTAPIELYYWPTPNGWKITIMLEELGVPYEVKYVNIGKGEQFEPDFLKISPNNRMPAIVDPEGPDGKPISVFESGAILQYLGRKFGRFYPAEERARVEVEQWLFWQMGGLGPMAGQAHHFRQYAPEQVPYAIARYTNEVNRLYGVMNRRLFHRRHGRDRLDKAPQEPGSGPRRLPASEALVREAAGAPGRGARLRRRQ
jgi:GST-like protein